jgi:hypothetical protein
VSAFLGVADGFDFRVRLSGAPVPSLADDLAAPGQNGADQGIGRSVAISPSRQAQSQTNECKVREHELAKSIAVKPGSPQAAASSVLRFDALAAYLRASCAPRNRQAELMSQSSFGQ